MWLITTAGAWTSPWTQVALKATLISIPNPNPMAAQFTNIDMASGCSIDHRHPHALVVMWATDINLAPDMTKQT